MIKIKPTPFNIWAFNTLFPAVAIPYTFETWLAAFIIPAVFKTNISTKKD
jgi:hypothetical protein